MKGTLVLYVRPATDPLPAPAVRLGVIALVAVIACHTDSTDTRLSSFSDDDWSAAALAILPPLPSCSESWAGGTVEQCVHALERVEQLREQHRQTEPPRLRKEVASWLNYAEKEIAKSLLDCRTRASAKEQEKHELRVRSDVTRLNELLGILGKTSHK